MQLLLTLRSHIQVTTSIPTSTVAPSSSGTTSNVGLIVGVVVGSLVFICLMVFAFLKCQHGKEQHMEYEARQDAIHKGDKFSAGKDPPYVSDDVLREIARRESIRKLSEKGIVLDPEDIENM